MHNNAELSIIQLPAASLGQGHGGCPATSSSSSASRETRAALSQLRRIISLVCPPRGLLPVGHPPHLEGILFSPRTSTHSFQSGGEAALSSSQMPELEGLSHQSGPDGSQRRRPWWSNPKLLNWL